MRTLTNTILFLIALIAVEGTYVLRPQASSSPQKRIAVVFTPRPQMVTRNPAPLNTTPRRRSHTVARESAQMPEVVITVTAIPLEPKGPAGTIAVGLERARLWRDFGQPDVTAASRDGERFLETYIYQQEGDLKATVVRLINGRVASVRDTGTGGPPLLVPQGSRMPNAAALASESK